MNYADSNFFLCVYLLSRQNEITAQLIDTIRSGTVAPLPVTWLTRLEVVNAIHLSVFAGKSGQQPHVAPEQASLAIADFLDDLARQEILKPVAMDAARVTYRFEQISHRHTPRQGFRTYDILHVSTALALGCREFWSFDARASKLAKVEGLKTL